MNQCDLLHAVALMSKTNGWPAGLRNTLSDQADGANPNKADGFHFVFYKNYIPAPKLKYCGKTFRTDGSSSE